MHLVSIATLRSFWSKHPRSKGPLQAWAGECGAAIWASPQDVIDRYPSADVVGKNRIVFNIGGNQYRLIVLITYRTGWVFVKFIGTHADYNKVDAATVDQS